MPFDLLDYPIVSRPPRLLSPTSAWLGHIPFALALVQMCQPNSIVELGTHQGDSYCAFCEAVVALGLPTRCMAVDTWTGDRHSGGYGEDVLAALRAIHDPAYAGFSRLLRSTFDEARDQFADASIDLLHIDGLHTYAAVRHDFESWLPKMSDRGVVVFHDTAERAIDFGVWQLWAEVTVGRPHFAFTHSHGLGVLAVGASPPPALLEFLDAANRSPAGVQAVFAKLGEAVELMRLARNLLMPLVGLQGGVNEWATRTGRPPPSPQVDVPAAFANPVGFTAHLCQQVRFVLNEDLSLRKL